MIAPCAPSKSVEVCTVDLIPTAVAIILGITVSVAAPVIVWIGASLELSENIVLHNFKSFFVVGGDVERQRREGIRQGSDNLFNLILFCQFSIVRTKSITNAKELRDMCFPRTVMFLE